MAIGTGGDGVDAAVGAPTCPVLRPADPYADDTPIRGEIYSLERLEEHAGAVAHAHGPASLRSRPQPLLERLADTIRAIEHAYGSIAAEVQQKRDPTPAQEWLLDNRHVIDD